MKDSAWPAGPLRGNGVCLHVGASREPPPRVEPSPIDGNTAARVGEDETSPRGDVLRGNDPRGRCESQVSSSRAPRRAGGMSCEGEEVSLTSPHKDIRSSAYVRFCCVATRQGRRHVFDPTSSLSVAFPS